jgi:hypothetical protein
VAGGGAPGAAPAAACDAISLTSAAVPQLVHARGVCPAAAWLHHGRAMELFRCAAAATRARRLRAGAAVFLVDKSTPVGRQAGTGCTRFRLLRGVVRAPVRELVDFAADAGAHLLAGSGVGWTHGMEIADVHVDDRAAVYAPRKHQQGAALEACAASGDAAFFCNAAHVVTLHWPPAARAQPS